MGEMKCERGKRMGRDKRSKNKYRRRKGRELVGWFCFTGYQPLVGDLKPRKKGETGREKKSVVGGKGREKKEKRGSKKS